MTDKKVQKNTVVTKPAKLEHFLSGTVVSTKMKDTVVVRIDRFVKHPIYGKFIKRSNKIKAHNPGNTAVLGQKVDIVSTRPISKDKHFMVVTK